MESMVGGMDLSGMDFDISAQKSRPRSVWIGGGFGWRIPAMTDFRAKGTIMGPTGLTAVFGMGTGVTPSVWSPEKRPAGGVSVRRS